MQASPAKPTGSRGKAVVSALALLVTFGAALAIMLAQPAAAKAQELPVLGTLTGECVDEAAVFHFEMPNPRDTTFNFAFVLSFGELGVGNQTDETSLAAGETFARDFAPETVAQPEWRVDIADADAGYAWVGQSNVLANPCEPEETTTTTTTTDPTTSTSTTTGSSTTTDTTTDTATDTTTDTFGVGPTTDTTTDTDIEPLASGSDGSGGGLANTGVAAIVVLVGVAGVLLLNGVGLTRITRPGWATRDED